MCPHSGCEADKEDVPLAGCNCVEVGVDVKLFAVAGTSFTIFTP